MGKTIEFKIPEGYVVDNENTTENKIILKWVDNEVKLEWDRNFGAVRIEVAGESPFGVVSHSPSYYCTQEEANRNFILYRLPSVQQLHIIAKNFKAINKIISDNNGFELTLNHYISNEKDGGCPIVIKLPNGEEKIIPDFCQRVVRYVINY